jgi:hypothetical protein
MSEKCQQQTRRLCDHLVGAVHAFLDKSPHICAGGVFNGVVI